MMGNVENRGVGSEEGEMGGLKRYREKIGIFYR